MKSLVPTLPFHHLGWITLLPVQTHLCPHLWAPGPCLHLAFVSSPLLIQASSTPLAHSVGVDIWLKLGPMCSLGILKIKQAVDTIRQIGLVLHCHFKLWLEDLATQNLLFSLPRGFFFNLESEKQQIWHIIKRKTLSTINPCLREAQPATYTMTWYLFII